MESGNRYTLFELNEFIRRIMALNFTEAIWISCELAQVSRSRGHFYLSVVEKDEGDDFIGEEGKIIAQSEAVIWQSDFNRIKRKIGKQIDQLLQAGLEVLIQVKVDYHERYGLKLIIRDIDPAFTVGKLELKRQETLKTLQKKGLLDKNKLLPLPVALQNIAVISSERAAGLEDFKNQLIHNAYGYKISYTFFNAAMQGEKVKTEVVNQLKKINRNSKDFDLVVMIRGGGAKLDLIAFDELDLCAAIATSKLPVLTGIGHEQDESIADIVAYKALKTPTAVAEWLIQYNLHFEMALLELGNEVKILADDYIYEQKSFINNQIQSIVLNSKALLRNEEKMISYIQNELPRLANTKLKSQAKRVAHLEQVVNLLNPDAVLKRGFSITMHNGKPIIDAGKLKKEDEIITMFSKGKVKSKVIKN